jgi:hypothetical protein
MDSAREPARSSMRVRRPTKESTAAGIYGVIVGSSVMAAAHADRVSQVVLSVLVTLTIYWAAERYARIVAERIHEGQRPTRAQLREQLTDGWTIVTASAVPLGLLALLGALGVEVFRAVLWALACSTLLLCLAGWEIGRDGRLTTNERVASAAVSGMFGVAMIVLKTLLH